MESHDDPTPAPRGRVPVVVLARCKTVPNPTPHWWVQPGGPAKSHQKEAAVARTQHLGADGDRGQDSPSRAPGKAYTSPGLGQQGDCRGTSPRVTRVSKPLPQLGNQSWDHPAKSVPEREVAGRRGKARERWVSGMFYPWADASRAEGRAIDGQSSPLSDRAPDSTPSSSAVCQPGGGLGPTAQRASGSS